MGLNGACHGRQWLNAHTCRFPVWKSRDSFRTQCVRRASVLTVADIRGRRWRLLIIVHPACGPRPCISVKNKQSDRSTIEEFVGFSTEAADIRGERPEVAAKSWQRLIILDHVRARKTSIICSRRATALRMFTWIAGQS